MLLEDVTQPLTKMHQAYFLQPYGHTLSAPIWLPDNGVTFHLWRFLNLPDFSAFTSKRCRYILGCSFPLSCATLQKLCLILDLIISPASSGLSVVCFRLFLAAQQLPRLSAVKVMSHPLCPHVQVDSSHAGQMPTSAYIRIWGISFPSCASPGRPWQDVMSASVIAADFPVFLAAVFSAQVL